MFDYLLFVRRCDQKKDATRITSFQMSRTPKNRIIQIAALSISLPGTNGADVVAAVVAVDVTDDEADVPGRA